MRIHLFLAIVLSALVGAASAQTDYPKGLQPRPAVAQLHGDVLILQERQQSYNTGYRTVQYEQDGLTKTKQVPYSVPISTTAERAIGPGNYRIFDLAGNQLSAEAAAERLAKATTVLTSDTGSKVDPQYLRIFQPDTLLVYLRPMPVSAMPIVMPMMAPPAAGPAPAPAPAPPVGAPVPIPMPPPMPLPAAGV